MWEYGSTSGDVCDPGEEDCECIEDITCDEGLQCESNICVFLISGYVSLSSIAASFILPLVMLLTDQSAEVVILGVIFCIFVVLSHRPNIKRLLEGKESRVNFPFHKRSK